MVKAAQRPEDAYSIEDIQRVNAFFSGVLSADSDISDVILYSSTGVL